MGLAAKSHEGVETHSPVRRWGWREERVPSWLQEKVSQLRALSGQSSSSMQSTFDVQKRFVYPLRPPSGSSFLPRSGTLSRLCFFCIRHFSFNFRVAFRFNSHLRSCFSQPPRDRSSGAQFLEAVKQKTFTSAHIPARSAALSTCPQTRFAQHKTCSNFTCNLSELDATRLCEAH